MTDTVRQFRRRCLSREEGEQYAQRVLLTPISERLAKVHALHLDDPEMLLSLLRILPAICESAPEEALAEASFLYGYLENLEVRYPLDPILYDEREWYLGETARVAGNAARMLARRDEAREWLDLSEAWFLATENSACNVARVTYQRLALRTEERDFAGVLKLLPHLIANFERMSMADDALKGRFLKAAILKELNRLPEAVEAYGEVIKEAEKIRNERLLASASVNLALTHCALGNADEAAALAAEATPALLRLKNHVGLAKLQWTVGFLLRSKGELSSAIEAYRSAQREFAAIGMHADVAAVHLVLADLLLDAGQADQAEWQIRAALPVIDEYKLVPEGIAALSLLRESVKRRQIDRRALRELHGYFPQG